MIPGPVVVEVTAASPEAAEIHAMVEACERAVGERPCVLARQAPEAPYAAVAIVTWLGEGKVRVEVAAPGGKQSEWRSRELVFQESDLDVERWRAVGFVLGTLASAATGQRAAQDEQAAAEPAQVARPVVPAPESSRPTPLVASRKEPVERLVWLNVGWLVGDGFEHALERNGAWARAGFRPRALPIVTFATLGYGSVSRADEGLSASFLDAGLGLGLALVDEATVTLDLGAELGAQRFAAEAYQPFAGSGAQSRWVGVGRIRPELAWYWSDVVGAVTFAELSLRGGQTRVSIGTEEVGQTERLGYQFGLGLSLRASR